jgi:hypothetical protein
MIYGNYGVCAETYNVPEKTDETTKEISEARSKIQAMYNAGAPLFTKEAMRDIHRQFKSIDENAQSISVKSVDGKKVDFKLFGRDFKLKGHDDSELIMYVKIPPIMTQVYYKKRSGEPFIFYHPIQRLTSDLVKHFLRIAFCSLQIWQHMRLQKKSTREFITVAPPRPQVEEFLSKHIEEWRGSQTCSKFRTTIDSCKLPPGITNIVAFACASFSFGFEAPWSVRSAFQHAMLLSLRDILEQKNGNKIQCYAQEPTYTEVDKLILKEYGITTLEDPEGWLTTDSSTVVISIAANVPVKQIISDVARPAIIIWEQVRPEGETPT